MRHPGNESENYQQDKEFVNQKDLTRAQASAIFSRGKTGYKSESKKQNGKC